MNITEQQDQAQPSRYQTALDRQLNAVLPGGNAWPSYSEAATELFWQNWRKKSPVMTRLAFAASVILLEIYQSWQKTSNSSNNLGDQPVNTLVALQMAEESGSFAIRQAFVMIKSIACLAYFSDPQIFEMATSYQHPALQDHQEPGVDYGQN